MIQVDNIFAEWKFFSKIYYICVLNNQKQKTMKTIRTYVNAVEAEMVRQLLENEGVRACVMDENMGSMFHVAVGGVKLMVDDADVEKAIEILEKSN